tara:strand:+ start:134 stop:766 length:633 start_codon:yes stop_codon:yes gene_type:complete
MVDWWSIIKFDPAFLYLRQAFKKYVDNNPDATDDEILEYLSDPDNIYDEYDMISDEDKRVGTLKDIDRFNENYGRRKYAGPAILSDYHKNVVIPLIEELRERRDPKRGALLGSALERELAKDPKINRSTLKDDLRIISNYFLENDKYKDLRVLDTVLTEEGNPDFVATEAARKKRLSKKPRLTVEELKERLRKKRELEEKRQRESRRGGF